ncbi:hypothetical protein [Peribacillus simplex]|uniref:hypothetical protein n=1 Tax=Peribacillus simplex TaxID=1478 RepID=UPI003D26F002
MKLKNIIIATVLIIPLSYGGVYAYNSSSSVKEVPISGKYIGFDSLHEMEEESNIIVVGKKISTKENIVKLDSTNAYTDAYSLANFEIIKVIKNKTDKVFDKKDNLTVMEYAATDTDSFGKKRYFHLEDYTPMKDGKHYTLYLRESKTDPGVYLIRGAVFGKVPLDTVEEIEDEKVKAIAKQAKEKYKNEITIE